MHLATARFELFLAHPHSLKEKRAIVKPIIEGIRRRYQAAVAEVDHQDKWQRCAIGVAVVSASQHHADEVMDAIERFVWSFPEVEVVGIEDVEA